MARNMEKACCNGWTQGRDNGGLRCNFQAQLFMQIRLKTNTSVYKYDKRDVGTRMP